MSIRKIRMLAVMGLLAFSVMVLSQTHLWGRVSAHSQSTLHNFTADVVSTLSP